jgi:glycine/D-amino acid oxidase-like deaminating enzyme
MEAARLGTGYREAPLWHDGVALPPAATEAVPMASSVDVAIVGAGYCGVMAGAELASRGREVAVLDADAIGTGASTRNGGMVIPELKHGPRWLAHHHGPLGGELVEAVFDAFALVERLVEDWSIDCHYARTGGLLLAHHEAQVPHLEAEAREWRDDLGEDARFLARDELASEIGSPAYHGGLLVERTGGLQPAAYHAGLVRRAVEQGAVLHGETRVTGITALGDAHGYRVDTTRGSLRAGEVLVAANASVDGIVPELRRRVVPMGSFIVATEPLDPALAASCIPNGRMVHDTKNFLFYWRRSPDDRLVFGGRTSLGATTVPKARDILAGEMVRVHPQLEGVAIDRAWGGNVAITFDRLPHCGRTPLPGGGSVAFATGCNGTGVALMTWFGQQAARWLVGEGAPPAFARLPFPQVPLHSLRDRYLPAVGQWFRIRDRYGR